MRSILLAIVVFFVGFLSADAQELVTNPSSSQAISLTLEVPKDLKRPQTVPLESAQPLTSQRAVRVKSMHWQSDRVCYRAPVFDQPALEQAGQCQKWQDLRSGALFMAGVVLYPLEVAKGRTRRCKCTPN